MTPVTTNFHTLHVHKAAEPKLRKAIIPKCNKEPVISISYAS